MDQLLLQQQSYLSGSALVKPTRRWCARKPLTWSTRALFKKAQPAEKKMSKSTREKKEPKGPGFLAGVVQALDFSETRSVSDARMLYDAQNKKKGEKLSKEQYQALRRKVGGTAKDYWKDWVDVKGQYTDKGYISSEGTSVPGLPFLIVVVFGLFAALAAVVTQTGGSPPAA